MIMKIWNKFTFGNIKIENNKLKNSSKFTKTFIGSHVLQSYYFSNECTRTRPEFCEFDYGEDEISWWKVQALDGNNNNKYEGELLITSYKLVFKPYEQCNKNDISDDYSWPSLDGSGRIIFMIKSNFFHKF